MSAAKSGARDGDVTVYDMRTVDAQAKAKAKAYGVLRVPTVVIDGQLADCCQQQPVSAEVLRRGSAN